VFYFNSPSRLFVVYTGVIAHESDSHFWFVLSDT